MKGLIKSVGMLGFVVVVVGATAGIGVAIGLGNTVVLAGLTALFCFIAATGGPLRSDLVLLACYAPLVVAGVAGPRLLGAVSDVAAIALLTVVVFVAALLPALGSRFVTVGLGLGMASVFGYGFQLTGTASAGQIIGAPALAVGVAIVLRLLLGVGDPGKPTREALADALAGGDQDTAERAVRLWLADRPRKWQTRVLGAGVRARATAAILDDRRRALGEDQAGALRTLLDAADAELAGLADAVRAKDAPDDLPAAERPDPGAGLPGETRRLVDELWSGVDAVRDAVLTRDESVVDIPRAAVRAALRHEAEGALSWRSAQLRHAVRCAIGMLLALVVARFRPGDPLTVSFLMTTFAVLQPEWRDTLSKAWQRVGGALGGAVVLALVLWLLPPGALLPLALVALLAGFPLMRSRPTVFNGCMVLMSVGMNSATKHLDARTLLVEYVLLMVLAVVIALLFGFAAVPGVRKPSWPSGSPRPSARPEPCSRRSRGRWTAHRAGGSRRGSGPRPAPSRTCGRRNRGASRPSPVSRPRWTRPRRACVGSRRRRARCCCAAARRRWPSSPRRPRSRWAARRSRPPTRRSTRSSAW
ncbi:FUSC family protein [Amycolatopsis sp. cmx-8-4]|uniref:FUSC family protein n=1 Tax=Amycolatopsis sp. cmx-8-4 TaxID=2790947 RepID=UPI00397A28A1